MDLVKDILRNMAVIALSVAVFLAGSFSQYILSPLIADKTLGLVVPCAIRILVTLLLAWAVSEKILKIDAESLGLKLRKFEFSWIAVSLLLPLLVLAFYTFVLPGKAFVAKEGGLSGSLLYGFFCVGLPAGVTEELVFRGMIFRYMKKSLGEKTAVIVPAILFACVHIMNMQAFDLTDLTLLVLAGSSVAVLFTLMALKSGSIWPGALAHTLWNFLIIGKVFGIGDVVNGSANDSYIIIPVESASKLLTGGNFGVEVALPSVAGYILATVFVCLPHKGRDLPPDFPPP